jgi:hypothetical protein
VQRTGVSVSVMGILRQLRDGAPDFRADDKRVCQDPRSFL